jgi:acetyl-CoA C-acetyltransferase
MAQAYIVAATRTAGGRRGGALKDWHPVHLAAAVLDDIVKRTSIDPTAIDDIIMGCVSQIGEQSRNVARNAVLASGLPDSVPAMTVDRQCGSSQQAIHIAAQAVMSGTQDVVIAAGVESMSRVPMGSPQSLALQAGIGTDAMTPKIKSRYGVTSVSQFASAEKIAARYGLTRMQLDEFALLSHRRAAAATLEGRFESEILPLPIDLAEGMASSHVRDEGIRYDASIEAIGGAKLLLEGGMLTAATSSQICDGAAAVMLVSEQALKDHGLNPLARIHCLTVVAGDPILMLEEPIPATAKALKRSGLKIQDIDLYEVNEAFASIPLAWLKATGADGNRLNVNGGAIALGHPLGASGAKLMTSLVHALRARGKRYGLQTMCEGGGQSNLTIIEAV